MSDWSALRGCKQGLNNRRQTATANSRKAVREEDHWLKHWSHNMIASRQRKNSEGALNPHAFGLGITLSVYASAQTEKDDESRNQDPGKETWTAIHAPISNRAMLGRLQITELAQICA